MTKAQARSPKIKAVRKNTPLFFLTLATLLSYGGFYDFITLGAGIILTVLLLYLYCRDRKVYIPNGVAFFLLCGAALPSILSVFFAVSPVMAWVGVLRMAVWVLYYLYAASYTEREREDILTALGYAGAAMALCSLVAFIYDIWAGVPDANGRIDGFFQYANTYALFLAVCLVLLLGKQTRRKLDVAAAMVLLLTLLLTGSRGTILLLAVPAAAGVWHLFKTRRGRMALLIGAAGVALVCILAVLFSGGLLLERFLSLGRASSSVNGRLLYNLDGLRILKDHPLGVGRGGYLYVQPLFQSGVYTLQFIHNDYLQAALDGGALAGALFTAAVGFLVFCRGRPIRQQLVVLMIALHCAIDFDLQFTAIAFLLLLCADYRKITVLTVKKRLPVQMIGIFAAVVFLYGAVGYYFNFAGNAAAAYAQLPGDLRVAEERLQNCATLEEADQIADGILSKTELSLLAWDCKHTVAAAQKDLVEMARCKWQYTRLTPYTPKGYEELADLLEAAAAAPDEERECQRLADAALAQIARLQKGTSPLAYRIADKPDLSFCDPIAKRLLIIQRNGER